MTATSRARSDLVVRDADLLVTMTGDEIPGGWVAVSDGIVDAVGPSGEEPEGERVLSARGCLVTPGLISAHHHMFQNLTRAFGPALNRPLLEWAQTGGEMWLRMDEEAAYVSAWVGFAELALGGCTATTDDLYAHPRPNLIDASIAASREVGLRFHPTRGAIAVGRDAGTGQVFRDEMVQDADTILADTERLIKTYHDPSPNAMVRIACGPSGGAVATPGLMEAAAELAERYDVRLTTHVSQEPTEEEWYLEHFGLKPIDWLESVGWATDRAWIAHCIFVDEDEISRLARWGTGVAHCPSTCCLVAGGVTPFPAMRRHGVPVGLSVDGSGCEHFSMWLEAHTALLLGRLSEGPLGMSARDALEMATVGSARCLGREGQLGVLEAGAGGDLVAWPLEGIRFSGAWSDPVEAWLRCGPVSARHTVVAGKSVVEDGELQLPTLDEMLSRHNAISREWQGAYV
jgi:cytosine/adenosine deaminase-related metal-dependent hydrolase